jgi:hypothetical protein
MTDDNVVIRTMHDVGLAAWFGGALMGAVGLNGAANDVSDPTDRSRVASAGWARWAPVNALAIAVHTVGGLGLIAANRSRVISHRGSRWNTLAKTALTGAAVASTAYSGWLGTKVARAGKVVSDGGAVPADETPNDVATAQQQLRAAQWVTPALTGVLIVLGAQQGEQQRPTKIAGDLANRALRSVSR